MSAITFFLGNIFFTPVMAAVLSVPVAEGDQIIFKGIDANIQIVGQASNFLKIAGVEEGLEVGAYVVSKKNNVIEITMNGSEGKRSWLEALSKPSPSDKRIEISGRSLPLEIHLQKGAVALQKWNKDVKVNLTQGRFSASNGGGSIKVFLQKGDINIQDHVGNVKTDSFMGATSLKGIQGDVESSLFSGQLQLEKVQGFMVLSTQQATSKVSQGTGTLQFDNGKGSLNVVNFQGRIEGQNQEGAVNIGVALDSEVDVRSKSGKVILQMPQLSGANLNLFTREGEILVPPELKVAKLGSEKSVHGKLRGDAQRGRILVRSEDGVISVK